ncbi:MAG: SRPBCC family protein [bacterium]|jgi:uncharacterized membrane protein
MSFETSVQINKPVEQVFSMFLNPALLPQWLTGLQNIQQINGVGGQVGSVSKMTFLESGQEIEITEEILAIEENKYVEAKHYNRDVEVKMTTSFENLENRTTIVKINADLHFKTIKAKMMAPVLKPMLTRRQEGDLNRFREMVESS